MPFLLYVGLTVATPAPTGLSEASADPMLEAALLQHNGKVAAALTGVRSLGFGLQKLGDRRQLRLSLRPTSSESGEGFAHPYRIAAGMAMETGRRYGTVRLRMMAATPSANSCVSRITLAFSHSSVG